MAMVTGPVFFDTSVLLEGIIRVSGEDDSAVLLDRAAEGRIEGPRTAWHCCLEFYAVSTRLPEEARVSPAEAARLVDEEILRRFEVVDLAASRRRAFLEAAAEARVAGGRLYDAHIAEIARLSGARIVVTGNVRHFAILETRGIRVLSPAELRRKFP